MAPSEGRHEVPDSEDEPMTSSPVAFMDGAADKLSTLGRVPLQDAQDAPTEPSDAHQATAENDANMPGTRTDGWDVDHHNASPNVDAKNYDGTDTQLDTMASEQARLNEANETTHILNVQDMLQPQPSAVKMPLQQSAMLPEMTLNCQREPDSNAEHAPDATTTNQYHPVEAGVDDVIERRDAPMHSNHHSPTLDEMQLADSDQSNSEEQITAANNTSNDNVHISDVKHVHKDGSSLKTAGKSEPYDDDSSSHEHTKQADMKIDLHGDSNHPSNVSVDSPRHQISCPSPEIKTPALIKNMLTMNSNEPYSMHVPTHISTFSSTRELPEAGGSLSSGIADSGTKAVVTTSMQGAPQIDNALPEVQLENNGTCSSSSSATATSSASHPTSTLQTEVRVTSEDTKPATNASPPSTTSTTISQASTPPNVPAVAKTPQEVTLAELKAQKAAMLASLAVLPAIQVLMEENATSDAECGDEDEPTEVDVMKAANKIVKEHIKLLHEYNELKDVGQGLMGLIADQRGVRIVEVQEEFGIEAND